MAKDAAKRLGVGGRNYDYRDLKVLDYGARGQMIVPVGTRVLGLGAVETSTASGAVETSTANSAGLVGPAAVDDDWLRMADDCLARHFETGGYMDACWALYKETSDGSSTYDWWGLHFFASMFTPDPYYWVGNGYVKAYRSGGPAQTWAYWDPRSDITGGCHTLELNFLGFYGFNHQACETWTFTKGSPTVTMTTTYHGNADGAREVAQTMTVRVAQGASSPVFGLNWDMATCRYPNPCP